MLQGPQVVWKQTNEDMACSKLTLDFGGNQDNETNQVKAMQKKGV